VVIRKRILAAALLSALLVVGAVRTQAATISVQSDRNPVSLNESFRLVFSAHGSVDGDPDFSPLKKDFEILDRSQSSQINIINGHFNHLTNWVLEVMAKRAGKLAIPPIHFGLDVSQAASVTVGGSGAAQTGPDSARKNDDFFMEVTASPKNPYVQAQVIYTVRLYRTVNLESATLSDPKLTSGDAIIEKLGKASQYQTRRHGRLYAVIERKYAVFPQQSGTVTIAPVVFKGQVVESDPVQIPGAGAIEQFDNFFNHFSGLVNQQKVHTVRLASSPVTLQVRPIPTSFTGGTWLPAKKLALHANLSGSSPKWQVGVPATRTLSIQASGLTAGQLPKIVPALGDGLKQYPDQPSLTQHKDPAGVIGKRVEKVAVIPSGPGTYTLPGITIPWWNTTTDRMETARIPARVIHVAAAAAGTPVAAEPPPAPVPAAGAAGVPAFPARDKPPTVVGASHAPTAPAREATPWLWISLVLAAGWAGSMLTLALAGRKRKRRKKRPPGRARKISSRLKRPAGDEAWSRLQQACANNDPRAAREELLAWAQLRWPQQVPPTPEEVGTRLGSGVQEEIRVLNAHLYGRGGGEPWAGDPLWQALKESDGSGKVEEQPAAEDLEPLYKL
jgi:hypothetical protein